MIVLSFNTDFNGNELSSIVMIPFLKIKKEKNIWYVTLLVANKFYEYNCPFQFKDYFLIWESTHQFEVKVQILELFAQPRPKRNLMLKNFLHHLMVCLIQKKQKLKSYSLKELRKKSKIGLLN